MLGRTTLTTTAIALALATPAAAQAVDLRSPDTRDAAAGLTVGGVATDLRSPDTRDAAAGVRVAAVTPPVVPGAPAVDAPSGGGFDWGDAGIGAAGTIALLSIGGGIVVLSGHRRRRDPLRLAGLH